MTDAAVTTVLDGFTFLESPRWRDGRLWFSDFYSGRVCSATADGDDVRTEATVEAQPSGLGWLPDGRLLVVSMRDRRILRREADGTLVTHADLSAYATGHLNDMAVDAAGRAYVGNFGFDLMGGGTPATAALHRADPDGTVTELATDLYFPNSIMITSGGTLVVNETLGNRITAFDLNDDGTLSNRRPWATFAPPPTETELGPLLAGLHTAPDGSCLDAEDGLWIADAIGGRLLRVVEGGTVTDELRPGTNVYACALGGPDGRTLYACAAPDFYEHARREATEGRMIALPVTVPA